MKRALLFILVAFSSYSGFSQTDTLSPIFTWRSALDTVTNYPYVGTGKYGYAAGVNNQMVNGFAQLYSFFNKPYGWSITGSLSVWIGNVTPSSTNSLTIKVWNVDSSIGATGAANWTGTGSDSVTGFPKTVLGSQSVLFTTIKPQINATAPAIGFPPKIFYQAFTTPIAVNRPFFLGYVFNGSYAWGAMAGDTVSLASNYKASGSTLTAYNNLHNNYLLHVIAGNHTYLSINSFLDGTQTPARWRDYNNESSYNFLLSIVPVVNQVSDNVSGLTKNNLTFFGCYPNPAVNTANVKFTLANTTNVTIQLMDMNARVLKTITANNLDAGDHIMPIETSSLAAGEYLYMISTSEGGAFASKLTVIK